MNNQWLRFPLVRKAVLRAISASGVAGFLLTALPIHAQVACAFDRPCITDLYISTTNALIANVNGSGWDVINVRWSRPGREGEQRSFKGHNGLIKVLSGTTNGLVYTVSVQGCNTRPLQSSRCTDWDLSRVKAGARPVANY
jgi:hypothetical protein